MRALALLALSVFSGACAIRSAMAAAAERPEVALEQEGVARPVPPREAFAWIDTLRQLQPATVARVEAAIGASLHRIERNDSMAVYEASGSARPWVRRVELRLPERANQGWSFFLILDLDPTLVELLPSDAMAYRAGARAGANPVIPPGWRDIFKYWELAAPDFLLWDNGDETILLRFRSQGPRRLQQCSLYRKSPPPAAGIREGHRALRLGNRKVETGLGSAVDALVNDSSTTAAQVQALQDAGWRMLWSPLAISAVDFVQKAILLPKDKNPQKSYAWLLWELGRIPRPLDAVAAARPAD